MIPHVDPSKRAAVAVSSGEVARFGTAACDAGPTKTPKTTSRSQAPKATSADVAARRIATDSTTAMPAISPTKAPVAVARLKSRARMNTPRIEAKTRPGIMPPISNSPMPELVRVP